jgi:hypothetical protein
MQHGMELNKSAMHSLELGCSWSTQISRLSGLFLLVAFACTNSAANLAALTAML